MKKIFKSSKETRDFAKSLAKKYLKQKPRKHALVIALVGDLGAGKTTFVQGFLRGLGVRSKITSPTFVLVKKYKITLLRQGFGGQANPNHQFAYHIDAYRIKKPKELLGLGLREILKNPENIILVEWADKIRKILPSNAIRLKFEHGDKESSRAVSINKKITH